MHQTTIYYFHYLVLLNIHKRPAYYFWHPIKICIININWHWFEIFTLHYYFSSHSEFIIATPFPFSLRIKIMLMQIANQYPWKIFHSDLMLMLNKEFFTHRHTFHIWDYIINHITNSVNFKDLFNPWESFEGCRTSFFLSFSCCFLVYCLVML